MKIKKDSQNMIELITIICKIIGILYVIPFYALIGMQNGALYGYAYNIYLIVFVISQATFPVVINKIVSEYYTFGYQKTKEKSFIVSKLLIIIISIIVFLVLFMTANNVSELIIGDIQGGNTKENIAFVIKLASLSCLIIPILNVYRGYFEGHKQINDIKMSNIIEKLIDVLIIVNGTLLITKVFKKPVIISIIISILASVFSNLVAYIYLLFRKKKNKKVFYENNLRIKEPLVSNKNIIKKILIYSFPIVIVELIQLMYNSIDILSLIRILVNNMGFSVQIAENVVSVISVWGVKLNTIIILFILGTFNKHMISMTSSYVQKDMIEVKRKINKLYQIILYKTIPLTLIMSFLAQPLWNVFYNENTYAYATYQSYVFVALMTIILMVTMSILQMLKEYKIMLISLLLGFSIKLFLNTSFVYGLKKLGFPPFFGAITTTVLGLLVSSLIAIFILKKKYSINFEITIKELINIVFASIITIMVLVLLKMIIPISLQNRILCIPIITLYSLIGILLYIFITSKMGTINTIFRNKKENMKVGI